MAQYEDFRKDVLYALARNGGAKFLDDMVARYMKNEGNDALDFHLHLRQIQDEKLVERLAVDVPGDFGTLIPRTRRLTRIDLTAAGWEWVRQARATEAVGAGLLRPPSTPSSPGD